MLYIARDIRMSYDDLEVLKGCDLQIGDAETVALSGSSGVGKSTLLSICGLLLDPTSGNLEFRGENLVGATDNRKAELRNTEFGFIFQSSQLVGYLTLRENVLLPAMIAGRKGLESKADELVAELNLQDRAHHYPHQLSIGQQRRALVARALLLDPAIVFADEPTNDLDAENVEIVERTLFGLPERGCSALIVSHDADLVGKASRVVTLEEGVTVSR